MDRGATGYVCVCRRAGRHPQEGLMTQHLEWLSGCGTALVTPFNAAGEVHEARFRALVDRQIAGGVRLLVPCGTTGEAATDRKSTRLNSSHGYISYAVFC